MYKICLENTANLLKSMFWDITYEFDNSYENPLDVLPSAIIDELIISVARLSVTSPLKNMDLYHLIATGRVKSFQLEDISLSADDIMYILMQLSSKCEKLISIKLKNIFCSNTFADSSNERISMRSNALECVLNLALKLESVESCIEFNLNSVRNARHLKQLRLNFVPKSQLFDFLDEENGQILPNFSLKVLDVFEDVRHPLSYLDIAVILRYCNELVEINCDVSRSLEYLHAEELYHGILSTQYKLEKCNLGSIFLDQQDAAVSATAVYIASLTCPSLKEIDVLVGDDQAVYALSDFLNLTSLLLQWEALVCGSFQTGVHSLLEKIGFKLRTLHIVNFRSVDFSAIGMFCPNLEELRLEYTTECNKYEFSPTAFQKVTNLHIETIDDTFCQPSSLVGLVSNCTQLKLMTIQPAEGLSDPVLQDILKKNDLSTLKEARIYRCSLSPIGIHNLASSLTSLEYLEISSTLVLFDEIGTIVHEINPQVIISCVTFD